MQFLDPGSRRPWPTAAAALVLALGAVLAPSPGRAAQADEALPFTAAVAARFPAPERRYATPAFADGRHAYTTQAELAALVEALADGGRVRRVELGRSQAGVPIVALHFTRAPGRPVALLIGQQHGNEPASAEALLAVATELADEGSALATVLDHIDVVVLPRANPDGALLGRRGNAQGRDVNRDHLQLATAEARAVAALASRFQPVLSVDLHEHRAASRPLQRLGVVTRSDLMLQYATVPNLTPALQAASEGWFHGPLRDDLDRAGLRADWYHTAGGSGADGGLTMGGIWPSIARNAFGLRGAVSFLLETRGSDLGRAHLARRVHSHVVAVASLLRSAAQRADALQALRAHAVRAQVMQACGGAAVVDAVPTTRRRAMQVLDAANGSDRTVEVDWADAMRLAVLRERVRPCAYWLAPSAGLAAQRLAALGVELQPMPAGRTLAVERYRATTQGGDGGPDAPRRIGVELVDGELAPGDGGQLVPLDQPLAALAIAALEPDSPFSYFATRVIDDLAQVARVRAPVGR